MTKPLRYSAAVLLLALGVPCQSVGAQAPGPFARLLVGPAAPLAPSQFQTSWSMGPDVAVSGGLRISPLLEVAVTAEYGSFIASPSPAAIGSFRTSSPALTLWGAWLDGAITPSLGSLGVGLHAGAGVVTHSAGRTGVGLRVGAGLEKTVSAHVALVVDASLVHGFTADPSGQNVLVDAISYAPMRVGVTWR